MLNKAIQIRALCPLWSGCAFIQAFHQVQKLSTCCPPGVLDNWQVTVWHMSATPCSNHFSMAQASHHNMSTYGGVASFYRRWSRGEEVFPLNLKTMSLSGCQTTSSQSKCKPSGDVHSWSGSVQSGFYGTAVRNGSTSLFLLVYILQWQNLVWRVFHLPEFLDRVFEAFTERKKKKEKKSGYYYV